MGNVISCFRPVPATHVPPPVPPKKPAPVSAPKPVFFIEDGHDDPYIDAHLEVPINFDIEV